MKCIKCVERLWRVESAWSVCEACRKRVKRTVCEAFRKCVEYVLGV